MSKEPDRPAEPGHSVLDLIAQRTGEVPRVTLREEDSAAVAAPVIDARSQEKLALPQGRGSYQLMGEIARGGMGVILKGHDTDLGRDVAVKVLDKRLAARIDVVQRFVEEAQIGGQLQHPGIVPVYELGLMADQRPYFTMKLVKGRTLATLLSERESPQSNRRKLIDVFESICQTMAYAHSRGVIHRDLKPANIMVGAFGEVQVADWGLAKVLARGGTADEKRAREAQSSQLTILETVRSDGSSTGTDSMVGSVMGTPAYMPPEQASGLVDRLDERSDVFALGAILCEILTGLPPYAGSRDEVIAAAAQAEQGPAHERLDASGADADLIKLTKRCLLAAPAARHANAGVLAERVHEHVVTVEERAHAAQVEAAEARVRATQERKARFLTLGLGASVLLAALAGGSGWLWVQNERAASERAEARRMQAASQRDRELAGDVNESLSQASLLAGGERWDEALLAAERARALAEGGGASEEMLALVDATLDELHGGREAAERREALVRDTDELLDELREVTVPEWDRRDIDPSAEVAALYARTFEAHGIELDHGTVQEAARSLTDRGLGSEIALVLDSWAEARRGAHDPDGAVRVLQIAHEVDPDPLRADLREALDNRDLDVLRWIANSGLEDQPASTILLLANAFELLDERETALRILRRGIEWHPGDFGLQYRLGYLLTPAPLEPGVPSELREAVGCYRAALALRPAEATVRFYLGRTYNKLGEPRLALEQFDAALERRPDDGALLFNRANCLRDLGDADAALAIYEPLMDRESPWWLSPWANYAVARALFERGDLEPALEHIEVALEGIPRQDRFHIVLLDIVSAAGSAELARDARRRILTNFPEDANALNNLAWTLAITESEEMRDLDEAVRLAERAVELDPASSSSWNTLGAARYYTGDLEGAVAALLRSDELEPHLSNWLFLAMAHEGLGHAAEARIWYDRGVRAAAATRVVDRETARFLAEAEALFGGR